MYWLCGSHWSWGGGSSDISYGVFNDWGFPHHLQDLQHHLQDLQHQQSFNTSKISTSVKFQHQLNFNTSKISTPVPQLYFGNTFISGEYFCGTLSKLLPFVGLINFDGEFVLFPVKSKWWQSHARRVFCFCQIFWLRHIWNAKFDRIWSRIEIANVGQYLEITVK